MRAECFPTLGATAALLLVGLATALPGRAQEPAEDRSARPAGFEPRFIDAEAYRDAEVLLYDWPALTRLVRWAGPVAQAVAEPDSTLPAELVADFRARVAELAEADPPAFLAAQADSVRSVLAAVEAGLDRAEAMLAESLPGRIATRTGEERANRPDRERTYATGPTAVRVPAGVDVGESDSLPGARLEGEVGAPNYLDLVADALDRLDALVHMVRKVGSASEGPGSGASSRPPDRAPPRPGP